MLPLTSISNMCFLLSLDKEGKEVCMGTLDFLMISMESLRMDIIWPLVQFKAINQTLEIAACALFDSSNGANWKMFVEDCCKAFETTTNAPKRPWKLSIAYGDGCIESAIKAVDPSVEFWSCWKHF